MFCVTETWLSCTALDNEILPSDFSPYHKDRESRGGGVAVNSLLPCSQLSTPNELEVVTVRIVLNKKVITICTAYIPPNCSDDYKYSLLSYLEDTVSSSETVFNMGDFNLPHICWSSLVGTSSFSNAFCDFVYKHNLARLIASSTHIKGNLLDLVLKMIPILSLTWIHLFL